MKQFKSLPPLHRRMTKEELTKRLYDLQTSAPPRSAATARDAEIQLVLQELEIYQIELEMQNRELRDSRQALEESQDRYINLYDFAPIGYVTLTEQGLMQEINLTAASMIGVERQWLINRSLSPWILSADLPAFRDHLKKCSGSRDKITSILHLVRRDKNVFPVELTSTCSSDPSIGTDVFHTTINDITDRVHMEESLRKTVGELEQERDIRELFVSALSHDLRTPLTAAKLSAQLLPRSAHNPALLAKYSERVLKNIDRIDQMINDLLDANRIRAGQKLPMNRTRFDLTRLVKNTLDDLSAIHGKSFLFSSSKPVKGQWNKQGLRRVIENLATNALKYGDTNQPITVSVTEDLRRTVEISIHNFGNPIPTQDQSNLFQPFRRSLCADSSEQKGWGIGLTLVKGTVEAHGGTITIESNARDGTTFRITLPPAPQDNDDSKAL